MEATLRAATPPGDAPSCRLGFAATAAYGLYAMPLAMAALPLYVHLPQFYGATLGVDLALLGAVLLVLRLADALVDPLLGAWSDRLPSRRVAIAVSAPVLALGMLALFSPPALSAAGLVGWLVAALTVVYAAYSFATINHGAWGAELSRDPVERTRITATREALALVGVVGASLAPGLLAGSGEATAGLGRFALLFAVVTLACAAVTLRAPSPLPIAIAAAQPLRERLRVPLADPLFRRLLAVFLVNGIASAIPDVYKRQGSRRASACSPPSATRSRRGSRRSGSTPPSTCSPTRLRRRGRRASRPSRSRCRPSRWHSPS